MNKNPICFGRFPKGDNPCAKCEFFDSCRYYAATAREVVSRSKLCSFEKNSFRISDVADYEHIPGECRKKSKDIFISMLARFFRYLLELDDYTAGLISRIITDSTGDGRCDIKKLSELRNCSRQAMHRKILSVIALHPELSSLFQGVMSKLSAGRKSFLRRRAAAVSVD